MLTEEQLKEIEERVKAATEGPWKWGAGSACCLCEDGITSESGTDVFINCGRGAGTPTVEDSNFIAHSRADVPALIRALRIYGRALDNACVRAASEADEVEGDIEMEIEKAKWELVKEGVIQDERPKQADGR